MKNPTGLHHISASEARCVASYIFTVLSEQGSNTGVSLGHFSAACGHRSFPRSTAGASPLPVILSCMQVGNRSSSSPGYFQHAFPAHTPPAAPGCPSPRPAAREHQLPVPSKRQGQAMATQSLPRDKRCCSAAFEAGFLLAGRQSQRHSIRFLLVPCPGGLFYTKEGSESTKISHV